MLYLDYHIVAAVKPVQMIPKAGNYRQTSSHGKLILYTDRNAIPEGQVHHCFILQKCSSRIFQEARSAIYHVLTAIKAQQLSSYFLPLVINTVREATERVEQSSIGAAFSICQPIHPA